jgi:murein DD-endopeptidase MepM/ murein hydrolase activator NlpD
MQETTVKPGQPVKRGQQIGLMGSTGRSTGPHVHYAVVVNGKGVDPRNYILDWAGS